MENGMIMVILGLIVGYLLFKSISRKQKDLTKIYSDILANDKHKVKGQWGR